MTKHKNRNNSKDLSKIDNYSTGLDSLSISSDQNLLINTSTSESNNEYESMANINDSYNILRNKVDKTQKETKNLQATISELAVKLSIQQKNNEKTNDLLFLGFFVILITVAGVVIATIFSLIQFWDRSGQETTTHQNIKIDIIDKTIKTN